MGVSTDAIIAFGFDLGDELPDALSDFMSEHEHDSELVLAADHGITLPEYMGRDYKEYAAAREEALAPLKIDLIPHCSGDYSMWFLAARGSNKTASRGHPQALEVADLAASFGAEVIEAMRAFCERHGIEWQEPKWHIFSMWS